MKMTRRDLLMWGAGAAAGLVVTPVPWKLLDDLSIWSQNWPWIPQPARGPVEVRQSFCNLCPQGCALRARMVEGWPVGVSGVPNHPISKGALCPLGFGAHQLNWHPQRLRTVLHRSSPSSWDEARAAFTKACSEGRVQIVDGQPGRAASSVFQAFVQKHNGAYRAISSPETQTLEPYATWTGVPAAALGYDLENAQTIVSFGAPLLDGWGMPGRFPRLWADRAADSTDPQLRLIQIETLFSRTAARAWRWVQVQPGMETVLAAGLARVLMEEHLVAARGPMPPLGLDEVSSRAGLSVEAIRDLARTIVARPPALVVADDDNPVIAALNVVLGAVGARGGIVQRSKPEKLTAAAGTTMASARAVLIDSTVPWDFSPGNDTEVFRFAAWDGGLSQADWLLPAPGFVEELTDVPTPPALALETYAVAPSLVKPPAEVRSAAQFLASVDASLPTVDQVIHARCEELFKGRAGTVYGQQGTAVAKIESAQKLEDQIRKGAVWIGDPAPADRLHCKLEEWPPDIAPPSQYWPWTWASPVLPPLATKLYQESELRGAADRRTA